VDITCTVLHAISVHFSRLQIKESLFSSNMEHRDVIEKMEQRFFDEKVIVLCILNWNKFRLVCIHFVQHSLLSRSYVYLYNL